MTFKIEIVLSAIGLRTKFKVEGKVVTVTPDSEDLFEAKQFVKGISTVAQNNLDVEEVAFVLARVKRNSIARAKSYKSKNIVISFSGLILGFLIGSGFGNGAAWVGSIAGMFIFGFAAERHYKKKLKEESSKEFDEDIARLL